MEDFYPGNLGKFHAVPTWDIQEKLFEWGTDDSYISWGWWLLGVDVALHSPWQ